MTSKYLISNILNKMDSDLIKFWSTYIFILLLGLGSCTTSFYLGIPPLQKLDKWQIADAMVLDYSRTDSKGMSALNIGFVYNEKEYSFKETVKANDRSKLVSIKIIFPKEDPSKAQVLDRGKMLGIPGYLGLLGILLIRIGYNKIKYRIFGEPPPPPPKLGPNPDFDEVLQFMLKTGRRKD
jgi:hypothetical protein